MKPIRTYWGPDSRRAARGKWSYPRDRNHTLSFIKPNPVPTIMKPFFATLLLSFLFATASHADIWRVDANTANEADFRTLQEAHDRVNAGDTLYVAGAGTSYGVLFLEKTLFIFGPGYFLDENPETQALVSSAKVDELTILAGAANSLITGMQLSGAIDIRAAGVTLQRNRISHSVSLSANNITLIQNYMRGSARVGALVDMSDSQGILIANNYLYHNRADLAGELIIFGTQASSSVVIQNTMHGSIVEVHNATVHNNILFESFFRGSSNDIRNNISSGDYLGTENGNQANVDMSIVFVGPDENSTDGQWQLERGSPALETGVNGEDVGMFGGPSPYMLSGIPSLPHIYFLSAPSVGSATDGLQVRLKVKSTN